MIIIYSQPANKVNLFVTSSKIKSLKIKYKCLICQKSFYIPKPSSFNIRICLKTLKTKMLRLSKNEIRHLNNQNLKAKE